MSPTSRPVPGRTHARRFAPKPRAALACVLLALLTVVWQAGTASADPQPVVDGQVTTDNVYVTSQSGEPWGSSDNVNAMNAVFGDAWQEQSFEQVDNGTGTGGLFAPHVRFIFLDGSDFNADALESFLTTNETALKSFAQRGGGLFINAAPNEGDGMSYDGYSIDFNEGSDFSSYGEAVDPAQAIFNGPFTPAGTAFSGNYFAHALVSGAGLTPLIERPVGGDPGEAPDPSAVILGEYRSGAGITLLGGMTMPVFHSPSPNAENLRENIISYVVSQEAPGPLSTDPASPANENSPKVIGTAAQDTTTVRLYTNATCTGTVAASGTAADFASPGLTVTVADDSSTTFYATDTDGDDNTSACSQRSVTYVEDSTAPAPPTLDATDPASPANNNSPLVSGTAEAGSTVDLYTDAACTSAVAATGTAADFASPGLAVAVADDSSTTFYATATDAAGNTSDCSNVPITYVEESTPPAAPTLTSTDPASPANENAPLVIGTAAAGSTIRLYTDDGCAGLVVASGLAADFASPGLTVAVGDDSSTTFYATATDGAGNTSDCSTSSVTYVEDSTAPGAPTLDATAPASPANDNSPLVSGTAAAGSTVRLYTDAACTSAVAASGSAADFASPGLTVTVGDDSSTTFYATATDAADNTSDCSPSSVTYVEDSTAPDAPSVDSSDPSSPANDNSPNVIGKAANGSTVRLYTDAACTSAVAASGSAAEFDAPGLTVTVPDDSSTTFYATATDTADNTSDCSSSSVTYVEESTPPAPPALTSTDPASPANENSPRVIGSAADGSTVNLYADGACFGAPAATGSAADLASPGLTVSVDDDSSTTFYATATDAAGNTSDCSASGVTYVEDSTAPSPPTLDATDPASPANDNSPLVSGTAAAGSTVRLYTDAACTSTVAASGSAADFASPGLSATVADDSSTTFYATATDAAANTSDCSSSSVTYVEDSKAPDAPTLTDTDPASPANENSPKVIGTAATGSTVKLYTDAACTSAVAASGSAAAFASPGLSVSVADDSSTTFYATATDTADNTSDCSSSSIEYVEDSTAPAAPTLTSTDPASPANENSPQVIGTAEAGSTVKLYTDAACTSAVAASGSAADLASPGLTVSVADNSSTTYYATATDTAGNTSDCSASGLTFVEDSTVPLPPVVTGTDPASPANDNAPKVIGTAPAGLTIRLYTDAACTSAVAASGSAADFASPGLTVAVTDDSTTTYYATATNSLNNTSDCSDTSATYVEDSTAPAPPVLSGTDPGSPASDNSPKVIGTAASGSTVKLYTDAACSGAVAASGSAADLASPGLTVSVADRTSTTYYATATDTAANTSDCSSTSVTYVENSVAPGSPPSIVISRPLDGGRYGQGEPVKALYTCTGTALQTCQGTVASGAAIATATAGVYAFTVNASDQQGRHATKTVHYTVIAAPALICSRREIAIIDVHIAGTHVHLNGVTEPSFAGKKATILLNSKRVGHATVAHSGAFKITLPLPSLSHRRGARYSATIAGHVSSALKLVRRSFITRAHLSNGNLSLAGGINGKFKEGATVTVQSLVLCTKSHSIATTHLSAHGTWKVTIPAPAGADALLYRARIRIGHGSTYTLPIPATR